MYILSMPHYLIEELETNFPLAEIVEGIFFAENSELICFQNVQYDFNISYIINLIAGVEIFSPK